MQSRIMTAPPNSHNLFSTLKLFVGTNKFSNEKVCYEIVKGIYSK